DLGKVEKFRKISQIASRLGWCQVPLDRPVSVVVGHQEMGAEILLVNTSIGSWELQNLPEFLRDKLRTNDLSMPVDLGNSKSVEDGPAAPIVSAEPYTPKDLIDQ